MIILETKRLVLRPMTQDDIPALKKILQDPIAMAAYEHAFSDEEVQDWLDRMQKREQEYGFTLWGVVLKETGEMIGQCGITMQPWGAKMVPEVGYLFQRAFWHNGYAIEAASACRDYAFDKLGLDEVFSIIRDNNFASQRVAERNGMTRRGIEPKHYYGVDMPHYVYSIRKEERNP